MQKIILNKTSGFGINLYPNQAETVIVVIHGASEGALRYSEFANNFKNDYDVITYNHPGHETGHEVDFSYDQLLNESKEVLLYAQANYKQVIIFAHSMGSLVIRELLIYVRDNTKIILSGAPVLSFGDKASASLAILGLKLMKPEKVSTKMNYKVFDEKSSKIGLDDKTWLSSQAGVVMLYKASKLTNQLFTNRSLEALLELSLAANERSVFKRLNNFEVLLVSGATDVFTNNGLNYRFVTKYAKRAKVKVYPNSYHEVHNDIDKNQLFKDIRKFIEKESNGKN